MKLTLPNGQTQELHPDDTWVRVELFRWQYGELPRPGETRRLDHRVAFEKVAAAVGEAVRTRDMSKMPTPMNMMAILDYAARHLPKETQA